MTPAPFNTLPGDAPPSARTFWLQAEDGVKLRAAHWASGAAEIAGTVLLFPGRTEYIEKYRLVADDLNAAGFHVIAMDWRGQGMSDRLLPDRRPGHVGRFADYQLDVIELVVAAQELDLPRPWHLLAHSMGGAIGLAAVLDGLPVETAVFSAPMWGLKLSPMVLRLARGLSAGAGAIGRGDIPAIGSGGYDPFVLKMSFAENMLTSDGPRWGRMVAEAATWPENCIGGVTNHWLRAALAECDRLAEAVSPPLPMLVALGGQEKIVSPQAIRHRVAAWPGARLLELPDSRHEPMMERDVIRQAFLEAAVAHFRDSQPA
ncbi:alpha/beta fold hydrolase [Paracoccus laeviglucosivorans]|uniref:Lysophospholipase n=1 Tax=Paracoccus laeviglucosivorans TaxID=1197861 RepID=A0A521C8M3_9RHOB|nr:alpha/beta hydrolase [Paracoccus laeviglucosivorans]SMO55789.1 lysophospholipase [Paracoccus laeviglucosivorans]